MLHRNDSVTYNGRKFTTTTDLEDALQHIKKGLDGNRTLLTIDNLELWQDATNSLLDNVRALIRFIENESDEVLVIITTTHQMKRHLDRRLRFSAIFTNKLNLNKATFEEIYKAIILRHGASHKILVGPKLSLLSNSEIEKEITKLVKTYDYNIGQVLQAWTYGTTMIEDNKVMYMPEYFPFGDFFTAEEIIILKYVLLYRMVNEMTIKNFVGERFDLYYKSALKRLINTKVLLRQDAGFLELNKTIHYDIKQLLIYKGTLQ